MDGWRPKGYADTADHPGGCAGQNILEIKNSGRWPQLVGKGEEEEEEKEEEEEDTDRCKRNLHYEYVSFINTHFHKGKLTC